MMNLPLAFLLGFLGSMHCAIMCGPLMLSLPVAQQNYFASALQLGMYQLGRILVYTTFGVLAGALGGVVVLFANQQTLSLVVGGLMIVFALIHFSGRFITQVGALQSTLIMPISKLMGKVYGFRFWGFFAGMLNGLIPCGMVYLALATSMNAGSIKASATFMFLFGLGTTPLMLIISLGGIYLRSYIRFNPTRLIPWFTLLVGVLFMLRSADLGIPFLSPASHTQHHGHVTECK